MRVSLSLATADVTCSVFLFIDKDTAYNNVSCRLNNLEFTQCELK